MMLRKGLGGELGVGKVGMEIQGLPGSGKTKTGMLGKAGLEFQGIPSQGKGEVWELG